MLVDMIKIFSDYRLHLKEPGVPWKLKQEIEY